MSPGAASELVRARAAYIAAVRRLDRAFARYDQCGIPLDPGPAGQSPYPWTAQHVAIVQELRAALVEVGRTRRAWDQLRGHPWVPQPGRPVG